MEKIRSIVCIAAFIMCIAALAFAGIPQSINYQGYLKSSTTGAPAAGPMAMTFSLYSSSPPRNNPVWRETQPAVAVSNGIYSVQLGSVTPINAPFDVPYFLGVNVNNSGELPLQPLFSTGYAFRAITADNVPASAIAAGTISEQMIASDAITSEKIAAGAVTDTQIGGPIGDAKLSANVALLDSAQTFTGQKTFSSTITGNISGTAASVTGIVGVENGGTGATAPAEARTNLDAAASSHTHDMLYQQKYGKTAVVAQNGGDYSSPITAMAAVASWCGTPSAANPCLLKIMPGVYDLGSNSLVMQPYVDIEGSGELSTIITSTIPGEFTGTVQAANNTELRSLTARNTTPFVFSVFGNAIYVASGSPRLTSITANASGGSNNCGIYNNGSSPVINLATVRAAGQNNSYGIVNVSNAAPLISNTTTTALGTGGSNYGIHNNAAAPRLINVVATATGGVNNHGMNSGASGGTYTIIADRSTFEGASNSIYNSYAGFTIQLGGCKLLGPLSPTGTFNQLASYSDTTQFGSISSGTQTFQTGNDTAKGLIVKGNSGSQSANLQEWQNSTGTAVASVSSTGVISGNGSGLVNLDAEKVGGKTLAEISAMIPADTKPLLTTYSGTGSGTVTSSPAGINCTGTCLALFGTGTSVTLTPAPSGTSTFTGWSGGICAGTSPCTVTMDAAKTVNAVFTANSQTLTVSRTGSGIVTSNLAGIYCGTSCSTTFPTGSSITLTATPDTGFTFAGWGGACAGTGSCTLTIDAAKSVSAFFSATTNSLAISMAGTGVGTVTSNPAGIVCGSTCSNTFNYGTVVLLNAVPDATSTFTGWSGACSGTGSCVVTMNTASSVTASFTTNSYQLTASKTGSGNGTITSSPASISCGATCSANFMAGQVVSLTATPDSNSTFAGWSGACSGTGSCNVTMNAAQSVSASFAPKTFTLSVTRTGAGTVTSSTGGIYCGLACSSSIMSGTTVTLTAVADSGSTLASWTGCDSVSGNTCTTTISSAKNISVSFNPSLSVAKSGTGSGTITSNVGPINCGSTCTATYSTGSSVSLSATPATDSIFAGWTGACSGTGSCTVTMDTVKSATALFMLNPQTLVVTVSGGGSVTSSPAGISCQAGTCAATFDLGATVILTATEGGSPFSGWTGACTGLGSCAVTMNALKSVSAQFAPF